MFVIVVSYSLEIKYSCFIVYVVFIIDVGVVLQFLQQVVVFDVMYNCWVYWYGNDYCFSDDGELVGIVGRLILVVIDGQGFDCVMVVVICWYGGIKFGVGGLVCVYGGIVVECLWLVLW